MKLRFTAALLVSVCAGAALQAQRSQLVIPAAGDVAGQNGTHFRSDITITNLRPQAQQVALHWLPSGDTGNAIAPKLVTLQPSASITSENFVQEYLQQTGLGSILIRGVDAGGALDETAVLHATSRIWTPQQETGGTTSQTMPAVPLHDIVHEHVAFPGHRMADEYRVNAGVVNLDNSISQTFVIRVTGSVQVFDPVVYTLTVKPRSMAMIAISWPEDPLMRVDVEVQDQPGGGRGTLWLPFVSSVDNRTGDSWSTLGVEVEP